MASANTMSRALLPAFSIATLRRATSGAARALVLPSATDFSAVAMAVSIALVSSVTLAWVASSTGAGVSVPVFADSAASSIGVRPDLIIWRSATTCGDRPMIPRPCSLAPAPSAM